MTPGEFITAFPMFKDEGATKVQRHIDAAALEMSSSRWGKLYALGLGNRVAHTIALENEAVLAAQAGGGFQTYDETQKVVGDTSVSRDGDAIRDAIQNPFQLTLWGREYLRLMRKVGKGALVLG